MSRRTIVIAEAGVNHNGSLALAKKLIDAAAKSGADYIKFQTFKAENLVTAEAATASYQKKNAKLLRQIDLLKKLELSAAQHKLLLAHADKRKIKFLSTPFDLESIRMLKGLGLRMGKIPSGEITSLPYLEAMAKSFPKILMSTGMATLKEVDDALNVLYINGIRKKDIVLLHCTTEYPAPYQEVNLQAMVTMRNYFKVDTGYSDHTPGIEIPVAAVALGAVVIEKHLTLNKNMEGPDHKASLEPEEFLQMVKAIRNTERAMGNGVKKPSPSEIKNKTAARKSIVAATDIEKGEIFTENNLTIKRPGNGLSPMMWKKVLGKKATRRFAKNDMIRL